MELPDYLREGAAVEVVVVAQPIYPTCPTTWSDQTSLQIWAAAEATTVPLDCLKLRLAAQEARLILIQLGHCVHVDGVRDPLGAGATCQPW